jgi:cytochrome c-type biogenesis protein CcmH
MRKQWRVASGEWRVTGLRRYILAGLLLALLTLGATTDSGTRFNDLGHRLMCTCGCGQVLMECNHVGCQSSDRMRAELMAAMQRGDSDDRILNWFVEKYGPVVLAAPSHTGFDRVAWLMPYAALLGGLALTGLLARRWRSHSPAQPAASLAQIAPGERADLRRKVHEETEL